MSNGEKENRAEGCPIFTFKGVQAMASKTYEIAFKLAGKLSRNFSSTFSVAGKSVGELNEKIEKLNNLSEKMKTSAKAGLTQIGAIGAAAGVAAGMLIKSGNDSIVALNKMQAQTGATDAEMKELSKSARELYESGKGENFAAVTAAMVSLRQASGLSGEALKEATDHALTLGKTFDYDINESTRAASQLMKQFGVDSTTAYGLIAAGAQKGADKNGDLLDTFNEYAVHYKTLGFSAEQMTQHLIKGAEDGAWSIDKVGDAMKEFNIRSKDGSKSSLEAFKLLGINGTKATQMFAAGGEQAQDAFFKTVEALEAMKDPVEKNAAGVALFGTQFEDLEAGALKTFLSMKGASIDAEKTLGGIKKVIDNDLGVALSRVKRSFGSALEPATQGMAASLNAQMPAIQAAMTKLTPVITQAGNALIQNMPAIISAITSATQSAVNFATVVANNWGVIGPIVKGLAISFAAVKLAPAVITPVLALYRGVLLVQKGMVAMRTSALAANLAMSSSSAAMATMGNTALGASGKLKGVRGAMLLVNTAMRANPIGTVITLLGGLVTAGIAVYQNWDTIKAKVKELWDWVSNFFGKIGGKISSAWDKAKGFFSGKKSTIEVVAKGGNVPQLASGGIVTRPTMAMVGEGREAEAVMPLSKLGSMIGGGGGMQVTFSPVINISGGGGDAYAQVKRGLEEGQANLKRELERLMNNNRRLSYV